MDSNSRENKLLTLIYRRNLLDNRAGFERGYEFSGIRLEHACALINVAADGAHSIASSIARNRTTRQLLTFIAVRNGSEEHPRRIAFGGVRKQLANCLRQTWRNVHNVALLWLHLCLTMCPPTIICVSSLAVILTVEIYAVWLANACLYDDTSIATKWSVWQLLWCGFVRNVCLIDWHWNGTVAVIRLGILMVVICNSRSLGHEYRATLKSTSVLNYTILGKYLADTPRASIKS